MSSLPIDPTGRPANPLIIERPDLQSGKQRAVFGVLTALFWLLWVVLWMPLVTVFGWAFFGYQFQFHMVEREGYAGFLGVLLVYALVIVVMGGSLLVWATYNHLRFRGMDRRKSFEPPAPADLAALHGSTQEEIARWQSLGIATVHHDAEGRILRVE